MQQVETIIYQIVILGILTAAGYVSGRTGYLPEGYGVALSKFVMKITAPALTITIMANYDFTSRTVIDGMTVSLLAFIFIAFSFSSGLVVSKILKLPSPSARIYNVHSMFGSCRLIVRGG